MNPWRDRIHRNVVQLRARLPKAAEVGTVFIASAVEKENRNRFIDQWNGSPRPLHLDGGRDKYGPYDGSLYLDGIGIHRVRLWDFPKMGGYRHADSMKAVPTQGSAKAVQTGDTPT